MKEFKRKCELATALIESCWDENNPNDGLTFDERLNKIIEDERDGQVKSILLSAREV